MDFHNYSVKQYIDNALYTNPPTDHVYWLGNVRSDVVDTIITYPRNTTRVKQIYKDGSWILIYDGKVQFVESNDDSYITVLSLDTNNHSLSYYTPNYEVQRNIKSYYGVFKNHNLSYNYNTGTITKNIKDTNISLLCEIKDNPTLNKKIYTDEWKIGKEHIKYTETYVNGECVRSNILYRDGYRTSYRVKLYKLNDDVVRLQFCEWFNGNVLYEFILGTGLKASFFELYDMGNMFDFALAGEQKYKDFLMELLSNIYKLVSSSEHRYMKGVKGVIDEYKGT